MKDYNVKVRLEGLLLFCFPEPLNEVYSHCEAGILTQTGDDEHAVRIEVKKKICGEVMSCRVNPCDVGMVGNPLSFTHREVKNFSELKLSVEGIEGVEVPPAGVRIAHEGFDRILNLADQDFYGPAVTVMPGYYEPSIFITHGTLTTSKLSEDEEFCRVSENVLREILDCYGERPRNWGGLGPEDKKILGKFAKYAEAHINLANEQLLVLKARKGKKWITLFRIPHSQELKTDEYRILISNLDKDYENDNDIVPYQNCAAFLYHSHALQRPSGKPAYGLSKNYDCTKSKITPLLDDDGKSDPACCDAARITSVKSLPKSRA